MVLLKCLLMFGIGCSVLELVDSQENGICAYTWSSTKTIRQSYIHTWYHTYYGYCGWESCLKRQLKSRIEYRTKYVNEPHRLEYCCSGYERISSDPLVCTPRCSPNCVLANCTSPGVCTCFDGHKALSLFECTPICDPPCIKGKCTDKNVCECDKGYYPKPPNDTHVCIAHCAQECENGYCAEPDVCYCNGGYERSADNEYYCKPYCSEDCTHGDCVDPNVCECNYGYRRENSTCVPSCSHECIQGSCTAPEVCSCDEGYIVSLQEWNVCLPYCSDPCVNAVCSEPEVCTCHENFTQINNSTCEPICMENCTNGECIAPDVCQCNDGFEPISQFNCAPSCTNGCINGNCTEPNVCTCSDGYELNENDDSVCEPICSGGCFNGNCTLPELCTCDEGFIKVHHNTCMPICPENCTEHFSQCKQYPECVQVGKHYFPNNTTPNTINSIAFLDNTMLTLNWHCDDIFEVINKQCTNNDCEACSSLPLNCIVEININEKFIDFICQKYEKINYTKHGDNETTDQGINSLTLEQFNYSITLIHPPSFLGLKSGKCDVCMCGSNFRKRHDREEAMFYFKPCSPWKQPVTSQSIFSGSGYVYLLLVGTLIAVGTAIVAVVVYKIWTTSSTYQVRKDNQREDQELTVEEEFLVNMNNIHEDD